VYEQTNQTQNGVYVVTSVGSGSTNWVLTRSSDTNTYGLTSPNTLGEGSTFFVQQGTTGAGETYTCNTVGTIVFGTTNITFTQISATQIYSAGTGLTLAGTQFSITNTAVTAASYGAANKTLTATVNAQGQLTALADTDIAIPMSQVTSGVLGATQGGTGQSSYSIGDILYADTTTSLARLADVAVGNALISGGLNAAPAWGKIALASAVSGTLGIANGGTGQTTANAAFNALAPSQATNSGKYLTTDGTDTSWGALSAVSTISFGTTGLTPNTATSGAVTVAGTLAIANGGTGATTRQDAMDTLAGATTAGQYLRGNGTDVVMANIVAGDVPTLNQNTTGTAGGLSGSPSISVGTVTTTAGSAAIPAITTTGDTNTGIFFPAADTIAFSEGGTESMRIHASGGVSIGNTTDPSIYNVLLGNSAATAAANFNALNSSGQTSFGTQSNSAYGALAAGDGFVYTTKHVVLASDSASGAIKFGTGSGIPERMRIDSSGRVGIGTASPRQLLSVGANLDLYSGSVNSPTVPSVRGSAGNNLILSGFSAGAVFLNFDGGTGGVNFCNGSGSTVASMSSAGGLSATTGSFSTNLLVGSGTALAPGSVSGFGAGVITEPATGYSAAGMVIGNTAGQHGSIVYGSNTMYFGTENGSASTMGVKATLTSAGNFNATGTISGTNITTGGNVTGSSTSCSGNSATATNLTSNQTNWGSTGVISAVVGQLGWKNYGNNHTIFDASNSTSPSGGAVNNTNAQIAWTGTYPTLMGWNGSNTYGVRVDSARVSDNGIPSGTVMLFIQTAAPTGWTKSTAHDNKALRIVSGTASSGGSVAFTTAFQNQGVSGSISVSVGAGSLAVGAGSFAVGATTLAESQMPSHTHSVPTTTNFSGSSQVLRRDGTNGNINIGLTGGGGSHTHGLTGAPSLSGSPSVTSQSFSGNAINLAVQYVDAIIATKD
jgi:hypothetical protein